MPIFITYGQNKKADVECFIKCKTEAMEHYNCWLKNASDVAAAEERLVRAQNTWHRVSDPNWGGSGNNPNRDSRITRQAKESLESAERGLVSAKELRERLRSR